MFFPNLFSYLSILLIIVLIISIVNLLLSKDPDPPPIYCLMVTRGDGEREALARVSVTNFDLQSFKNKYLVIINEGKANILSEKTSNKIELHVQNMPLGTMRNLAMELVPPNAIWTTWDDDDWRSTDYLSTLYTALSKQKNKKYLMFTRRIDHSFNNDFTYQVHLPSGTFIFFCYKDPLLRYDDVANKEDAVVKRYLLQKQLNKLVLYENDPKLYIRFIHQNNTSVYLDKNKSKITQYSNKSPYFEYPAYDEHIHYVNTIKKKYYNNK